MRLLDSSGGPAFATLSNMFQARQPDDAPMRQDSEEQDPAELEFEQILKARDELLEGLSHDLKNALSSIVMNTSLARRVVSNEDQCVRQMIDRIQEASDRIRMAMQDALDMTGCVSGTLSVNPARREAKILVGDALAQIEAQRVAKNVTIQTSFVRDGEREGLSVVADHEKVPTALARLFAYGIKVSPAESQIEIKVERDRHEVLFRMILPPQTLETHLTVPSQAGQVFERQGKKPGLYLVRGIAEIFGGHTWAKVLPDGRSELGVGLKNGVQDGAIQLLVQS